LVGGGTTDAGADVGAAKGDAEEVYVEFVPELGALLTLTQAFPFHCCAGTAVLVLVLALCG